jgi:hypothetical protein
LELRLDQCGEVLIILCDDDEWLRYLIHLIRSLIRECLEVR